MISRRKIILPLSLFAAIAVLTATAQPSSSEIFEDRMMANDNPGIKKKQPMTALSLGYRAENATSHRLMQMGKDKHNINIEATTFQHLGENDRIWGYASYDNRKTHDVVWNETSDFLLLYPYVMADSRGGDFQAEQYSLHGGFAHQNFNNRSIAYGFEAGYRALQEYRQRDPRPNNTVADLQAKASIAYTLKNQTLALSFLGGKYKQTKELIYMNELGAGIEYHLTGLGNDYSRFSGGNNSAFFKGHSLGLQGDYQYRFDDNSYFNIDARYKHFYAEKVLQNLNRLPLNSLSTDEVNIEAVRFIRNKLGISLFLDFSQRHGTDNFFGDGTGNIYEKIGSKRNFRQKSGLYGAKMYWQLPLGSDNFSSSITPSVSYYSLDTRQYSSNNSLESRGFVYKIISDSRYSWKKTIWSAAVFGLVRHCSKGAMNTFMLADERMADALETMSAFLNNNEYACGISLRYDSPITDRFGIFTKASFCNNWFSKTQHSQNYEITLGLTLL